MKSRANRKQVWIPAELHKDVHFYAESHNTTAKDFVTEAIVMALLGKGVLPYHVVRETYMIGYESDESDRMFDKPEDCDLSDIRINPVEIARDRAIRRIIDIDRLRNTMSEKDIEELLECGLI